MLIALLIPISIWLLRRCASPVITPVKNALDLFLFIATTVQQASSSTISRNCVLKNASLATLPMHTLYNVKVIIIFILKGCI